MSRLIVDRDLFCARWNGDVILIKRERLVVGRPTAFGLRWFVPELLRQWRLFADVAIAAILLYALGLALPIFFQLVIDKVLVHESFTTLYVLAAGATAALAFDAIFGFLRRYLLLYATNKVDIRVATKTFGHLLGLPVTFFEHISAGVLVKHMQQAARIREFLTGRLFLTTLDALSLFVFIPVLALYSVKLTCVVLAFTDCQRPCGRAADGTVSASSVRSLPGGRRAAGPSGRDRARHAHGQVAGDGAAARQGLGRPLRTVGLDALRRREDFRRRPGDHRISREDDDARHHLRSVRSTSSAAK